MSDWMAETGAQHTGAKVDPDTPSVARMYDYFLGGKDNFASDQIGRAHV